MGCDDTILRPAFVQIYAYTSKFLDYANHLQMNLLKQLRMLKSKMKSNV